MKYLPVGELIFLGSYDCSPGYDTKKECIEKGGDTLYVTIKSDPYAQCGRGVNSIYFKGHEIASEMMTRSSWGIELSGPSIGLYSDAERWLLNNLSSII